MSDCEKAKANVTIGKFCCIINEGQRRADTVVVTTWKTPQRKETSFFPPPLSISAFLFVSFRHLSRLVEISGRSESHAGFEIATGRRLQMQSILKRSDIPLYVPPDNNGYRDGVNTNPDADGSVQSLKS